MEGVLPLGPPPGSAGGRWEGPHPHRPLSPCPLAGVLTAALLGRPLARGPLLGACPPSPGALLPLCLFLRVLWPAGPQVCKFTSDPSPGDPSPAPPLAPTPHPGPHSPPRVALATMRGPQARAGRAVGGLLGAAGEAAAGQRQGRGASRSVLGGGRLGRTPHPYFSPSTPSRASPSRASSALPPGTSPPPLLNVA